MLAFLLLSILPTIVHGQWAFSQSSCSGCPQMPFFPFPPFPPMPPMLPFLPLPPIMPAHVGNGMGAYVSSGRTGNGMNYASASSFASSNGNGPSRTISISTGTPFNGGGHLPFRPWNPSNTVHEESEKRQKLPGGGELITKTMVEKTPNGQRVSTFSYSQNSMGPVIPNGAVRNNGAAAAAGAATGKLPFSTKERLEDYKSPVEKTTKEDGEVYHREGSGEVATATANQSANSIS